MSALLKKQQLLPKSLCFLRLKEMVGCKILRWVNYTKLSAGFTQWFGSSTQYLRANKCVVEPLRNDSGMRKVTASDDRNKITSGNRLHRSAPGCVHGS